jgi:excisionase family DNA binding protein
LVSGLEVMVAKKGAQRAAISEGCERSCPSGTRPGATGHAVRCHRYCGAGMKARPQDSEYMNAQALAVHLGVAERTVRRWIKSGELHAEKNGSSYLIRREDGERLRLGKLANVVDDRSHLVELLAERDRAIANLSGKYEEAQGRVVRFEEELHAEQRRAALAEARLELASGAELIPPARRAA